MAIAIPITAQSAYRDRNTWVVNFEMTTTRMASSASPPTATHSCVGNNCTRESGAALERAVRVDARKPTSRPTPSAAARLFPSEAKETLSASLTQRTGRLSSRSSMG